MRPRTLRGSRLHDLGRGGESSTPNGQQESLETLRVYSPLSQEYFDIGLDRRLERHKHVLEAPLFFRLGRLIERFSQLRLGHGRSPPSSKESANQASLSTPATANPHFLVAHPSSFVHLTAMAMGKRPAARQASPMWVDTADLPTSDGHPFFERLNRVLEGAGFDAFVEGLCAAFYAARMGCPSLRPGRYFRLLFIGYFEGLSSERGIAWRVADSLSLRSFLDLAVTEAAPDHSTLSRTRRLIDVETHVAVFTWVLERLADAGLVRGKTVQEEGICDGWAWQAPAYGGPDYQRDHRGQERTSAAGRSSGIGSSANHRHSRGGGRVRRRNILGHGNDISEHLRDLRHPTRTPASDTMGNGDGGRGDASHLSHRGMPAVV